MCLQRNSTIAAARRRRPRRVTESRGTKRVLTGGRGPFVLKGEKNGAVGTATMWTRRRRNLPAERALEENGDSTCAGSFGVSVLGQGPKGFAADLGRVDGHYPARDFAL